ncbi:MAG: HAMP domain-containing sensor histidine kinase, partial [Rhizobacter sp.]
SAIQLSARLLEKRGDDDAQKIGERIARSAKWMGRMIEDLLDLTRARLGQGIPISPAHVDLKPVVQSVVQERLVLHPDSHVEVVDDGALEGSWDADRLVQVVSNLVGNALRHGTGKTVTVKLDGRHKDRVRLSVMNEGNIPAELLPSLFDPFTRVQRQNSRTEGLGLGLYIVQQIVQSHGGSIEVTSEPGQLTCFHVSLPRGTSA